MAQVYTTLEQAITDCLGLGHDDVAVALPHQELMEPQTFGTTWPVGAEALT